MLEVVAKHIQCQDRLYLMGKQLWIIVEMLIDLELEILTVLVRKTKGNNSTSLQRGIMCDKRKENSLKLTIFYVW